MSTYAMWLITKQDMTVDRLVDNSGGSRKADRRGGGPNIGGRGVVAGTPSLRPRQIFQKVV